MSTTVEPTTDTALPGLATALDPDALVELLSRRLPECADGVELLDARVDDVQYTPGRQASVLVKLRMRGSHDGRTARQMLFVKCLPAGEAARALPPESLERYRKRRSSKSSRRGSPLETAVLDLPEYSMAVHAFPLDPVLSSLVDVTDPAFMKEALHRAWQPRRVRVRRVKIDVLGYTPEARAALRYEVLAEHKETGLPEIRRLVGKLQLRKSPATLFAGHWAVWRRTQGRAAIVPPAGYVATANLSLQEYLTGHRLSDLAGSGAFIGHVRQAARAVAGLHATRVPLLAVRTSDKERRGVERWTDVLTRLCPHLAARLDRLRSRLISEIAWRMRLDGTVHADFHLANVLADRDGVTIIDLDQLALGDPMVDVGRFLGSLRVCALRIAGDAHALADVGESFLEAYLDRRADDERRARLFESAALLIAAASPFRLQREGWEHAAEALIEEAECMLDASARGRRLAVSSASDAAGLSHDDRLVWAADPTYAQALLVPLVGESYGRDIEVTECRPSNLEPGHDSLHVRWVVKGYRGRDRWRGAVEGFTAGSRRGSGLLRRLTALRAATEGRAGCLRLPRPLGALPSLSLIVVEPPVGGRAIDALAGPEARAIQEALGRALAGLAATEVEIGKEYLLERDLRAIGVGRDRLVAAGTAEASRVVELLDEVDRRLRLGEPRRQVPTIRGLRLEDVVLAEDGMAVRRVRDVVRAPVHHGIGSLLAQVARRFPGQASWLRDAYCRAAGVDAAAVAPFEALALLRRCTRRMTERPDGHGASDLLRLAAQVLGETRSKAASRPGITS